MTALMALFQQAGVHYDRRHGPLARSVAAALRGGFGGAAAWMAAELHDMRAHQVESSSAGATDTAAGTTRPAGDLLAIKYALALAFGGVGGALGAWAARLAGLPLPLLLLAAALGFAFGFYAFECQLAFVVPLQHDHPEQDGWTLARASRALVVRAGGTWVVMPRVMVIAMSMLLGGFVGRGFLRSWCVGCLAVCIWYERLRLRAAEQPLSRLPAAETARDAQLEGG